MLRIERLRIAMDDRVLTADWTLAPGARVALLGPSGSGKSTLLDCIAGFRRVEAGRILWGEEDLTTLPPQERPVSILFQDGNVFPHLSVGHNLALALRPDGRRIDAKQTAQTEAALARVGLKGFAARMPSTLSGGQQSRVALARVLLQRRAVLLLDEPFAALGPAARADMTDLVRDVAGQIGALTVMVSHNADDAKRFADAVMLIEDGVVAAPVETGALFADPPPALRRYLG